MLRLARQRSRAFVQCSQLSLFAVRQKHIPTAVRKAVISPAALSSQISKGAIEVIDSETILNFNEKPFRLPAINIGDYVEAFRYVYRLFLSSYIYHCI